MNSTIKSCLLLVGGMTFFGTGCHTMYTSAIHTSLKNDKIQSSTIALFPVVGLESKKNGCFSIGNPEPDAAKKNQERISKEIVQALVKRFSHQKFVSLAENDPFLMDKGHEMGYILSLVEEHLAIVKKIKTTLPDSTLYTDLPVNEKIGVVLSDLRRIDNADYAVLFLTPKFVGEWHANYYAGTPGSGGMLSASESYSADLQVQVWDCRTGQMVFASGIIASGSNYGCFLLSAKTLAIQSVTNDLVNKLYKIFSVIIEQQPSRFAVQ